MKLASSKTAVHDTANRNQLAAQDSRQKKRQEKKKKMVGFPTNSKICDVSCAASSTASC
jgi:hypothetical protein